MGRVITDKLRQRWAEVMRQRNEDPDFQAAMVEVRKKAGLKTQAEGKGRVTRMKNMYPEPSESARIIPPSPDPDF